MQVFQWDGGCNEVVSLFATSDYEQAGLEDLDLNARLDCLEAKAEVMTDWWFAPARNRGYSETPGGTWILTGHYGRNMGFALACNPKDDKLAREELKSFVVNELKEFDGPPEDADPEPCPPNFIAVNVEGEEGHVAWFAYFRSEPADQDLGVAYEAIRTGIGPALEPEAPEARKNALSRDLGLVRFYMGQAV